jgi:hypothetical protein
LPSEPSELWVRETLYGNSQIATSQQNGDLETLFARVKQIKGIKVLEQTSTLEATKVWSR